MKSFFKGKTYLWTVGHLFLDVTKTWRHKQPSECFSLTKIHNEWVSSLLIYSETKDIPFAEAANEGSENETESAPSNISIAQSYKRK